MTDRELLLGAEVIARAALDDGLSGVYAYPGTPSTEITEYIQQSDEARSGRVRAAWSANEKTAYEAALGMSYAGKRSMVCMKHVGLNVAADAFINSAVTGVKGGLVVVVADDPSMHSSQNEQDTRYYARFAQLPLLEPSNQQEAYDCMRYAFNFSETTALPVLVRITTRLSHSRSTIVRRPSATPNPLLPDTDRRKWILLPANARRQYQHLLDMQPRLTEASEQSPFNRITESARPSDTGIIAFGLAYNYVMETISRHKLDLPVLKLSHYPLPPTMVSGFAARFRRIIVAEEGYPIYEELFRGFFGDSRFAGRLDGTLPRTGELTPDALEKALVPEYHKTLREVPPVVAPRPPELCQGCGHRDLYDALNEVMSTYEQRHVFADIGCYTLGALPPYNAINTCVDMGASVTMAKGAADAGLHPAVAVIGDSTFTHSGITGLLDAVNDRSAVTIIISDNYTTAMTGGQDSAATHRLADICRGIGVEAAHIRTLVPLKKHHDENLSILKEEFEYPGVSVIIACRECIQTARRRKSSEHKK
ncbi:MAG: indolepyruvate ferredoxin oxidoreductase [Paludibacter sp. 47-17]|nr:MAG: indolepyruvate ferredoxin oxidoreductase [Paludibacter sp. 47-17]